ncbi:MAG: molybdate ABC transporter substrate-binding protein [Actinobacteria bacterium]|nr:molybdate ABC transporter substrate-binding protein [Actinomycetota bacterium]
MFRRLTPVVAIAVAMGACGGGGGTAGEAELTVFAAASLEPLLDEWRPAIEDQINADVRLSFASSSVLARQVVEGAPADVLITADRSSMRVAAQAEAVRDLTIVARNRLIIVVAPSNPRRINSLRDLTQRELHVVLCDPAVPCGRLTARLLSDAGVSLEPSSLEENVSAAVGKVVFGQADATVAYASDVRSRPGRVEGVDIPEADDQELEAVYVAAVVTETNRRGAAERFIEFMTSSQGRSRLQRAGFLVPGGQA